MRGMAGTTTWARTIVSSKGTDGSDEACARLRAGASAGAAAGADGEAGRERAVGLRDIGGAPLGLVESDRRLHRANLSILARVYSILEIRAQANAGRIACCARFGVRPASRSVTLQEANPLAG